jgi:two-component sensor histidine kinase
MASSNGDTGFAGEVKSRFGLLPNFFASTPDAPELIEQLWVFAKSGYLDNPIPPLFKERLFVYLSRFCEVRYCILRHCAFLIGRGNPSGDPSATPQAIQDVIQLLKKPTPWQRNDDAWLMALEIADAGSDWPAAESELEDHLFNAATIVFAEPARAGRALRALRHALGGKRCEHLLGFLAFVRAAHYWTLVHPGLQPEEDVVALLAANEELARLLLEDPEAARCDMGARLFSELEDLRGLNERRELEKAKHDLEIQLEQKELLIQEVNHRIKNSLQIASSILRLALTDKLGPDAADAIRKSSARILAIASVHEHLYRGDDVAVVSLDRFLADLCKSISGALDCVEGMEVDISSIEVPTDMAVPLALIVNELVTNVIKYAGPPCRVEVRGGGDNVVTLSVSDTGRGPREDHPRTGLGTRIVEAFAKQLGGQIKTSSAPQGYTVKLEIPVHPTTGPNAG